jgi:hypothetical protein
VTRRMNTHLDDVKCAFVFGVFREERSNRHCQLVLCLTKQRG